MIENRHQVATLALSLAALAFVSRVQNPSRSASLTAANYSPGGLAGN